MKLLVTKPFVVGITSTEITSLKLKKFFGVFRKDDNLENIEKKSEKR
jgi:hypothetical protein